MNRHTFSFRLTFLLVTALATTLGVAGGFYALLRHSEAGAVAQTTRLAVAKNSTYQLLETLVATQSEVATLLRLKDPDEIEQAIARYQKSLAAARTTATRAGDVELGKRFVTLADINQKVIDQILL